MKSKLHVRVGIIIMQIMCKHCKHYLMSKCEHFVITKKLHWAKSGQVNTPIPDWRLHQGINFIFIETQ